MSGAICPECRDGKHDNCNGDAWDMAADQPAACSCQARGHQVPPLEVEVRGVRWVGNDGRHQTWSGHLPDGRPVIIKLDALP